MIQPAIPAFARVAQMAAAGMVITLLWVTSHAGPAPGDLAASTPQDPVRGADELFWVPTLEQALAMARVTGKPIFLMGYSLVGDGSTYTKFGPEFCRGVF